MRLNRLRSGELLALVGLVGLVVTMFTNWYAYRDGATSYMSFSMHTMGWTSVGWFAAGITAITCILAGLWLFATVTQDSPALPVAAEIVTNILGVFTVIALLSRLVFQPGLGIGLGNAQVSLQAPAYLGPLFAILLLVGSWRATGDDRLTASYSKPPEIELRPLPE